MDKSPRDEGRGTRDETPKTLKFQSAFSSIVHRKFFSRLLLAWVVITSICVCGTAAAGPVWWVRTVAEYPHDPSAFTQGLVVHGGRMYEGTGIYGKSTVRRVDIETGKIEQMVSLAPALFGEGITVLGERLYQLTWKNRIIIVYDVDSFDVLETVPYGGEGWGLTHDGAHLILSDGSASLRFLDPETLAVEREITVREGETAVARLNELEYVRGEIWANVWYQDRIVRISPLDGKVLGWIDLSSLSKRSRRKHEDVLNGIAFDADSGRLFVTGKNWPTLYEIEVVAP